MEDKVVVVGNDHTEMMEEVKQAMQEQGIEEKVIEAPVPDAGDDPSPMMGDRPHMLVARAGDVARELGITFSPPAEVEGVECEDIVLEDITEDFIQKTRDMLKLLAEINGLGLAGPQIGIKKKFMVYWDTRQNMPYVCYNPKYYPDGKQTLWAERCLTYGDLAFAIKRYKGVRAVWWEYDPDKKALIKKSRALKGLQAEVFQHETDHLNGVTIATAGLLLQ